MVDRGVRVNSGPISIGVTVSGKLLRSVPWFRELGVSDSPGGIMTSRLPLLHSYIVSVKYAMFQGGPGGNLHNRLFSKLY